MATLLNNPIFDVMPDFTSPPTLSVNRASTVFGEGPGPRVAQFSGKHARHTLNHGWRLTTREAIRDFCEFFDQQGGRHGGFFVPSWQADLDPVAGIANGESLIQITPINYPECYGASPADMQPGSAIMLIDRDGTKHFARVIASEDGDPEVITLEPAVTRDWTLGEFFICFLHYVRFVSDAISLDFNGVNDATVKAAMIENVLVATENTDDEESKSTDDTGDTESTAPSEGVSGPSAFIDNQGNEFQSAGGNTFTT